MRAEIRSHLPCCPARIRTWLARSWQGGATRRRSEILRDLPDWFEFDDATPTTWPRRLCSTRISPRKTARRRSAAAEEPLRPCCGEVHLLVVARRWHRRGVGTELLRQRSVTCSRRVGRCCRSRRLDRATRAPSTTQTREFYPAAGSSPSRSSPILAGEPMPDHGQVVGMSHSATSVPKRSRRSVIIECVAPSRNRMSASGKADGECLRALTSFCVRVSSGPWRAGAGWGSPPRRSPARSGSAGPSSR